VNFVAGEARDEHETPKIGPVQETGAWSEAGNDAFIGGFEGLAAEMIAVALKGIGPLISAGPIAGGSGGLTVGAAAGGIIGLLKDHGFTEGEAEFYAEGVRRGGSLLTLLGKDDAPGWKRKSVRSWNCSGAIGAGAACSARPGRAYSSAADTGCQYVGAFSPRVAQRAQQSRVAKSGHPKFLEESARLLRSCDSGEPVALGVRGQPHCGAENLFRAIDNAPGTYDAPQCTENRKSGGIPVEYSVDNH
jgi:hypothetical protein